MAEIKKIKEIPTTLVVGSGKSKEEFIHYISLKKKKSAQDTIKQVKGHFKKTYLQEYDLKGEKIYSIYMISN